MWAPRTLWRVGRHALLAVASTWSEESLSLSLTCRSFLGGHRAFLSSPLLFTPSCRALPERCAPPKLLARNGLSCDAACSIHITQSAVIFPLANQKENTALIFFCRWIIRPYNLSLGLMPIYMYLWLRPEIRHWRIWRLVQNKKSVF